MPIEDLKPHVEEILNVINEEVDREEIRRELEKFLEYGVPIEQAKKTLLKKYGGPVDYQERKLLADLQPNEKNVHLLAQILTINKKQVNIKGKEREIYYGFLRDESGTIPFTSWKPLELERNDVIEVINAYTREWQGAVQVNFGDRVKIEKRDKDILPEEVYKPKPCKIMDLKPGIGFVEVEAVILELEKKEVKVNGDTKTVFSGILGDETGKTPFTAWYDFNLEEKNMYKIKGGYVKSWRGIPQLSFDENATVEKIKENVELEIPVRSVPLHELVDDGGAFDVEVHGTVIEIQSTSGVIYRCPECNRVLTSGEECRIHGRVKGLEDFRVKCVIDDGTGSAIVSLNKEQSEKLLGRTIREYKTMSREETMEDIWNKLFTKQLCLRGNALLDSFGVTFIPREVSIVERNLSEETKIIQQELEALR